MFALQLNLTYKWTFNNTLDNVIDLPSVQSLNIGDSNQARPNDDPNDDPYGVSPIYTNQVGHQMHHHHSSGKSKHHRFSHGQPNPRPASHTNGRIYPYKVDSFQHFGTVMCNAQNAIGQSGPCVYHIMTADIPDAVRNCTGFNATANSVQVSTAIASWNVLTIRFSIAW